MSKEVLLIFQDCPFCGEREEWGRKSMKIAQENGIILKETSFKLPGAKGLIQNAISRGVDHMPFFTDGEKFSYNLQDFVENQVIPADSAETTTTAKTKARKRKAKTVEKEDTGDEPISEAE